MEKRKKTMFDIIIGLGMLAVVGAFLSAAFIVKAGDTGQQLENVYQKSLYDVSGNINNIELKLSKLMASGDEKQQSQLMNDIWRQSSCAADNLSQLPLSHEQVMATTKFVNQLGDVSWAMSKKLSGGAGLSGEDARLIGELHGRCAAVGIELRDIADKIGRGWLIKDHADRDRLGKTNGFGSAFSEMDKMAMDYPKMIYDGPFSDSVKEKTYKAVEALPEVSEAEARGKISAMLADYAVEKIDFLGNANGDINTHEFSVKCKDRDFYVQMTKSGGVPVMISSGYGVSEAKLTNVQAIEKAERFAAEKMGFADMKGVWVNRLGNIAYVNLVYRKGDVSFYPDMVKVKIDLDGGSVVGAEAYAYACNHNDRTDTPKAGITEAQARGKVSKNLDIRDSSLAVIPKGDGELLAYQYYCSLGELDFIVYIDAATGGEADILRVIDKEQGNLVM